MADTCSSTCGHARKGLAGLRSGLATSCQGCVLWNARSCGVSCLRAAVLTIRRRAWPSCCCWERTSLSLRWYSSGNMFCSIRSRSRDTPAFVEQAEAGLSACKHPLASLWLACLKSKITHRNCDSSWGRACLCTEGIALRLKPGSRWQRAISRDKTCRTDGRRCLHHPQATVETFFIAL